MRQLFFALIFMVLSFNVWSMSFSTTPYHKRAAMAVTPGQVTEFFKEFPELEEPIRDGAALNGKIGTISVLNMKDIVYLVDVDGRAVLRFRCNLTVEVGYRPGSIGKSTLVTFETSIAHSEPNVCKEQFVKKYPQSVYVKRDKESQIPGLNYEEAEIKEFQQTLGVANQCDADEGLVHCEGLKGEIEGLSGQ